MADQAEEESFSKMWEQAQRRFKKITRKNLEHISLEQAVSLLEEETKPQDPGDNNGKQRIKSLTMGVIDSVQILGGLAAQGASKVFGPANICFGAITILLNIPVKASKLYEHLSFLLEEILDFLKQFQIYRRIEKFASLDREFRQSVHKLMIAFVDICALCTEFYTRKGSSFSSLKSISKLVLFDNDSKINESLERFRRLCNQHRGISDAVTLEKIIQGQHAASGSMKLIYDKLSKAAEANSQDLHKLQDGLAIVVKNTTERQDRESKLNADRKLCTKLGVPFSQDRKESHLVQINNDILEETGNWLDDMYSYEEWSNLLSQSNPLLLLAGPSGSGKTSLASAITRKLKHRYPRSQDHSLRLSVACYSFESDGKATISDKNTVIQPNKRARGGTNSSSQAIHSLKMAAIQFVDDDDAFAQKLWNDIEKKDIRSTRKNQIANVFSTLFSAKTMPFSRRRFYVVVLDGLDKLTVDEAKSIIKAVMDMKVSQLRFIITGTKEVFEACCLALPSAGSLPPVIEIDQNNQSDIRRYIDYEINHEEIFQSDGAGMQAIVSSMQNKLPQIVQGSFRDTETIIDHVKAEVQAEKDTEAILRFISENNLHDMTERCDSIITDLKKSLSTEEIHQLNELLMWTIYGSEFRTDEMKAALFLMMKKPMFQGLEMKVGDKFSKLLKIDEDGFFVMRDNDMTEYLVNGPRLNQDQTLNISAREPRISMQISIVDARVSQVQRFLWKLTDMTLFNNLSNFPFTDLTSIRETSTPISCNDTDASLTIFRRYFDLLFEEPNDQTAVLRSHATAHILSYIPQIEYEEICTQLTDAEKQDVANKLLTFFQNPDTLKPHLTIDFFRHYHLIAYRSDFSSIKAFMTDPTATATFRMRERSWAQRLAGGKISMIFYDVAVMIARCWLCDAERTWDAALPFIWLTRYLDLLEYMPAAPTLPDGDEDFDFIDFDEVSDNGESSDVDNSYWDGIYEEDYDYECEMDDEIQNNSYDGRSRPVEELVDDQSVDQGIVDETPIAGRDPVQRVVQWIEKVVGLATKDALWYERIGLTYLATIKSQHRTKKYTALQLRNMHKSAEDAFDLAKATEHHGWQVSEGCAKLSALFKDKERGVDELMVALAELRAKPERTDTEQNAFLQALVRLAEWYKKLDQREKAAETLQEAIRLSHEPHRVYYKLFTLYGNAGQDPQTAKLLTKLHAEVNTHTNLTGLGHFILHFCRGQNQVARLEAVFKATRKSNEFQLILDALGSVRSHLRRGASHQDMNRDMVALSLCYGIALAYYTDCNGHEELALDHFDKCIRMGLDARDYASNQQAIAACKNLLIYAYSQARSSQNDTASISRTVLRIMKRIRAACEHVQYRAELGLMLASVYVAHDRRKDAQKLLLRDVQHAFEILHDEDIENDYQGYGLLADVFMHLGDYANAFSAFSLADRHMMRQANVSDSNEGSISKDEIATDRSIKGENLEPHPNSGPQYGDVERGLYCNGICNPETRVFKWSSAINYCQICMDVLFCDSCLKKQCSRKLEHRVCSPDHKWVQVPSQTSELRVLGLHQVRMGGKLAPADGPVMRDRRTGGSIVSVSVWLTSIGKKWGIAAPFSNTSNGHDTTNSR